MLAMYLIIPSGHRNPSRRGLPKIREQLFFDVGANFSLQIPTDTRSVSATSARAAAAKRAVQHYALLSPLSRARIYAGDRAFGAGFPKNRINQPWLALAQ